MVRRSVISLLLPGTLCVLALLAGGPLHGWLHHAEVIDAHTGQLEIHGGACEHLPEHAADDHDCLLCSTGRSHALASTSTQHEVCDATLTARVAAPQVERPRSLLPQGLLGARAPPVIG